MPILSTEPGAVVHLVIGEGSGLPFTLGLGRDLPLDVKVWHRLPRLGTLEAGHLLVVDLAQQIGDWHPRELLPALNKVDVWLVLGRKPVDPVWLEIVQYPRVNVIASASDLAKQLAERLRAPAGARVAALVLAREPTLERLAGFVQAICAHPWRIRRPRDLAVSVGEALRCVKARCNAEGFTRVEHFIVCVRAIGLEQLRLSGLSTAAARALVGFEDPSNMRRHIGRALLGSPEAAQRIHHLVAI